MSTAQAIIALLLFMLGLYLIMRYALNAKAPDIIGDEVYSLTAVEGGTQILTSEEVTKRWQSTTSGESGSTLAFYIWPQLKDRTAVVGNEYATAVNLADGTKFKIYVASDAGRAALFAPAALDLRCQGCDTITTVDIPNVPLQRWSHVAIVKQGRQFRIYVNGKLAASQLLVNMPAIDTTKTLRVGDPRLTGQIADVMLTDYPMASEAVASLVKDTSNADGKPYLSSGSIIANPWSIFSVIGLGSFFGCPGGLCNAPKRANPFEQWSSPYA